MAEYRLFGGDTPHVSTDGMDKYTGDPVRVRWGDHDGWIEITSGEDPAS